jgi:hypothetical protein
MEERNAEARGKVKPVLAFVKKARGVAIGTNGEKVKGRSTTHCGASKST